MSAVQDTSRRRLVRRLGLVAGALLILALSLSFMDGRNEARDPRLGTPVMPGVNAALDGIDAVRVTTSDTIYTLTRSPRGWVLQEAGGYPVRISRMASLAAGLETLTWEAARTSDPAKFNRIGLGDPRQGGTGALIETLNAEGAVISSLITGRKTDRIYARRPDDDVTFRVAGDLPPFYRSDAWLDLEIVEMPGEVIRAVRLVRTGGESLYLQRVVGGGPRAFRPAPPNQNDRLASRLAASGPALALTRLAPIDVKPLSALSTQPIAQHYTMTHDGLEVAVTAYREPDGFYITLHAVEAGEGARRAETINEKADGWAFRLNEYDWNDFTPEIRDIVIRN